MALHTRRIEDPQQPVDRWPWHKLSWKSVAVSALATGSRRMEAETYLSEGHAIRKDFALAGRCKTLGEIAKIWQPSRLKGITVSRDFGTPFLAATQVFDLRPVPRKWLSLERTDDAKDRFAPSGMILVTCSGSVGRATLAHAPHDKILISHDLLRVEPLDPTRWGWVYAYLRSQPARAMMTGEKYGHMIKHLEPEHLAKLPIPDVTDEIAKDFQNRAQAILTQRNQGFQLAVEAENLFEKAIGPLTIKDWGENGFKVNASSLFEGRRRLEAIPHNPGVQALRKHLSKASTKFDAIRSIGLEVWLPLRFRRIPAKDGLLLVQSADIFEINPDFTKKIADGDFGDLENGRIKDGWLLLARSGQTYGLNGNATMANKALEGKIVSDDVIRIAPGAKSTIRTGYLLVAISHPILGRPLVKSLAYGSSIPHIEPEDFRDHKVIRLGERTEKEIANLAEAASNARSQADILERALADDAGGIIAAFLLNPTGRQTI